MLSSMQKTLKRGARLLTLGIALSAASMSAHAGNGVIADALQPTVGKPIADGLGSLYRDLGKPLDKVGEVVVRKPLKWLGKRLGIR